MSEDTIQFFKFIGCEAAMVLAAFLLSQIGFVVEGEGLMVSLIFVATGVSIWLAYEFLSDCDGLNDWVYLVAMFIAFPGASFAVTAVLTFPITS